MVDKKKLTGRPTKYTQDIADLICEELASGLMLGQIIKKHNLPCRPTVHRWILENEYFRNKYASSRKLQADALVEEMMQIADNSSNDSFEDEYGNLKPNHEWINRSRLRVDVRKWHAARIAPKKYGDTPEDEPEAPKMTKELDEMTAEDKLEMIKRALGNG